MSKQRWRGGWACGCMVTVLPLVEEEMLLRGLISNHLDFYQLAYNMSVSASARTHAGGGVFDTGQYGDAHLHVWRQWGCEVQRRVPPSFSYHGHGVMKGCPHISKGSAGAEWQAQEWERGRNGLRGRGPITGPGPTGKHTPTWQQAVKERTPILVALKDDIASAVVAKLKAEYDDIARAVWAADVIPNTFSGNTKNKTVPASYAVEVLGSRTRDLAKTVWNYDAVPNTYNPADPNNKVAPLSALKLLMDRQRKQGGDTDLADQLAAILAALTKENPAA